jgi:hypothetical protein
MEVFYLFVKQKLSSLPFTTNNSDNLDCFTHDNYCLKDIMCFKKCCWRCKNLKNCCLDFPGWIIFGFVSFLQVLALFLFFFVLVENLNLISGIILSFLFFVAITFEICAFHCTFWTDPGTVPDWWVEKAKKVLEENHNSFNNLNVQADERYLMEQPLLENGFPVLVECGGANSYYSLKNMTMCSRCSIPRPPRLLLLLFILYFNSIGVTIGL